MTDFAKPDQIQDCLEFALNPALQGEFRDLDTYLAYRRAVAAGAKILSRPAKPAAQP